MQDPIVRPVHLERKAVVAVMAKSTIQAAFRSKDSTKRSLISSPGGG